MKGVKPKNPIKKRAFTVLLMYLALTMIHPRSSQKNALRSSGLVEVCHFYVFINIRFLQTIDFT